MASIQLKRKIIVNAQPSSLSVNRAIVSVTLLLHVLVGEIFSLFQLPKRELRSYYHRVCRVSLIDDAQLQSLKREKGSCYPTYGCTQKPEVASSAGSRGIPLFSLFSAQYTQNNPMISQSNHRKKEYQICENSC
jgi:hypothetical protein